MSRLGFRAIVKGAEVILISIISRNSSEVTAALCVQAGLDSNHASACYNVKIIHVNVCNNAISRVNVT